MFFVFFAVVHSPDLMTRALDSVCKAFCSYGNQQESVLAPARQTLPSVLFKKDMDKMLVSGTLFQDRLCKHENCLEVHDIFKVSISAIQAGLDCGDKRPLNLSS